MRSAVRLTGILDVAALRSAVEGLAGPGAPFEVATADPNAHAEPLDAPAGGPVRARLLTAGRAEHLLQIAAPDPIAADLLAALPRAYTAALAGRPPAPPERRESVRYALELATDRPRSDGEAPRIAEVRYAPLPGDRGTVLAAWLALLGRRTGRPELTIGVAGPDGILRPLHADLSGDPSLAELAGRVRADRTVGGRPSFQVTFDGTGARAHHEGAGPWGDALFAEVVAAPAAAPPDLALVAGGAATALRYRAELFDLLTVGRLHAHLTALLSGGAGLPLSRLPTPDAAGSGPVVAPGRS